MAWPSTENFAAVASEPILVSQSPLSSLTFSVLISFNDEKRSLVVPPPLVIQFSPAGSKSSSDVNSGAAAMPPPSVDSAVSASAGSLSSVLVDPEVVVPPLPPQAASTIAAASARNNVANQSRLSRTFLPVPSEPVCIYRPPFRLARLPKRTGQFINDTPGNGTLAQ